MTKGLYIYLILFFVAFTGCSPDAESENSTEIEPNLNAESNKVIRISTPTDIRGFAHLKNIMEKAYNKLGFKVEFITLPAVRSMHDTDEGVHADAEFIRTKIVEGQMKNSIRIPIPISTIDFCAVVKDSKIKIQKWEDFNQYSVAIIKGYVLSENKITGSNVLKTENSEQALSMLQSGRVQVAALVKTEANFLIELHGYEKLKICPDSVEKIKVYHYINKKHKNLVPQLTEAFKELTGNEVEN